MFQEYFNNLKALTGKQLFLRFGIPVVVSFFIGLLSILGAVYGNLDSAAWDEVLSTLMFTFMISISIWISNQELGNILYCHRKLKHLDVQRIFIQTTVNMLIAAGVVFTARELSHLFFEQRINAIVFAYTLSFALLITLLINALYIGIYFFSKWKEELLMAEQLKQEQLKSQLYALRNQLDPHFLFNSLTALEELINENKEKATEFVEDLAGVYRYILDHREDDWVELSEEIDFMKTYLNLLNHKTGNMLQAHFPKDIPQAQIPVLAGQLLLENVFKHNIIDSRNHVDVHIWIKDEHLWVANTLRLRNTTHEIGMGLENLKKRYQMLSNSNIQVDKKEDVFQVGLPLKFNKAK